MLITGLGLTLAYRMQEAVHQRALDDAVRLAEVSARVGITPLITPDDLTRDFVPLDPARVAELQSKLGASVSSSGVVRFKIWNLQHWIVFSDNPTLIGRWFPADDPLRRSFDGERVSEVTDLSGAEELEERDFGQLLAVYVPLRVDAAGKFTSDATGKVIGSFEVYLPYKPIAAQIASDTRQLYAAIAIGTLILYLALFRLVAGASRLLRRQSTENERLATTDLLTGLDNRISFVRHADAMLREAAADERPVTIALVDIDRFQEVNDTLGHDLGDTVLIAIGQSLRDSLGPSAIVARLGGDEFAVAACVGEASSGLLGLIAEQVAKPITVAGITLDLSGSVGGAASPRDGSTADALLRRADVAMYHAKRSRRRTAMYSSEIDHHTPERLALAAELRGAIDDGQLFLVYQPKMRIDDRSVHGVEALVRWRHPTRGVVPPGEFLPVIEHTELIRPLTTTVLRMALDQAAAWRDRGLDLSVAVNLSTRLAVDPAIVTLIASELGRRNLPPHLLEIELTESSLVDQPERLAANLRRLHDEVGVSIAIDDFGTGYASLAYLTSFPVDVLKIDRSFVADVCTSAHDQAVVRFTTDLGRSFGMKIVAEGVEDAATIERLGTLGVEIVQGYHVARPAEAATFEIWLDLHRGLDDPDSLFGLSQDVTVTR